MSSFFFSKPIRVTFTNRGLASVVTNAIDDTASDKEVLKDAIEGFKNTIIPRELPPLFKSIPELLGLDYVGYRIEKQRFDKTSDQWISLDEFKVIGSAANVFRDTRVAYGELYRYRISSVVKVTVKKTAPVVTEKQDASVVQEVAAKKSITSNSSLLSGFLKTGLQPKTSFGIQSDKTDISADVQIQSDASGVRIVQNPVENISSLSSQSKLLNPSLAIGKATQEELALQQNETQEPPQFDYYSMYFESEPGQWFYISAVETIPPPYPSTVKYVPDSVNKKVLIYWLKPANDQRDIAGYKVFRRNKLGDSWTEIASLKENETFFIDNNVDFFNDYIYALACVDVHGTVSFLSSQVLVQLNPNIKYEKQERLLKWVSGGGLKIFDEENFVNKKFYNRTEQIIAQKSVTIAPNTKFGEASKTLIIRFTSLDTHEKKEVRVVLKNVNIKPA